MTRRRHTPASVESELLHRSARRCCLCFGLHGDIELKKGQIAHLDGNPSNNSTDNLAWLCLLHHDEYDSTTSQSKGLTKNEVKKYREELYEAVSQMRNNFAAHVSESHWPIGLEVPSLIVCRRIDPTRGLPKQGIQFIDRDPTGKDGFPMLYLSVYFKTSQFFGDFGVSKEKWLYLEAHIRPAFSLRVQVRAWTNRDVFEFLEFLHNPTSEFVHGYDLHGARPESNEKHSEDSFIVWRENNENRLMISTYTSTNAAVSVHARFNDVMAGEFFKYLIDSGFSSLQEFNGHWKELGLASS